MYTGYECVIYESIMSVGQDRKVRPEDRRLASRGLPSDDKR